MVRKLLAFSGCLCNTKKLRKCDVRKSQRVSTVPPSLALYLRLLACVCGKKIAQNTLACFCAPSQDVRHQPRVRIHFYSRTAVGRKVSSL